MHSVLCNNGSTIPTSKIRVTLSDKATAAELKQLSFQKQRDFNEHLTTALSTNMGDYELQYRGGKRIVNIPGTEIPFRLDTYQEHVGTPYQQIVFVLNYGKFHLILFHIFGCISIQQYLF